MPSGSPAKNMAVSVRRPGESTQPVSNLEKRANPGAPKAPLATPSRSKKARAGTDRLVIGPSS